MRILHREQMHEIWEKAKTGELKSLNAEEKHLAKIMMDHEDEFFNDFEFADMTADHEYDPDTETNPFLHISIHSVVENQLDSKDPIEALQFYNAMRQKKMLPPRYPAFDRADFDPFNVTHAPRQRTFRSKFLYKVAEEIQNPQTRPDPGNSKGRTSFSPLKGIRTI